MSLKTKAAIALSVMSSWFGTSAAQNSGEPEKPDSVKRSELIAKPAADKAAKTFTEFHSVQENPDSIQPESIAEIPDSVQVRFEQERKAFQDSIILEKKHANLKASEKLMLYVIAHFEGMKSRAYYDKAAKIWTINLGNTIRPDGKPVRPGDCIRTEEQALEYVSAHIDNKMSEDMVKYLPLDQMTQAEIAIMGSLFYNCGTGILHDRKGNPKQFALTASEYFTTRGDSISKEFDKAFMNYCHVKGSVNKVLQERRKNELTFLHGEVQITVDEQTNIDENIVNLKNATLGSLYGCRGDPETIMERFSEESRYHCPTDSLKVAIDRELAQKTYVKRARPTPRPKTTAQKRPSSRSRGGR